VQRFTPDPDAPRAVSAQPAAGERSSGDKAAEKTAEKTAAEKTAEKKAADKEARAAKRRAERERELAEHKADKETELRIYTQGRYGEAVWLGGERFIEKASNDFAFAVVLMGMFLMGVWFVRSGVMEHTGAHLRLFRRLALVGLPIGIAIGLAGSLIALSHTPGDRGDGWGISRGLLLLGNLPACLGYVGLVVLMLHSKTALSRISVLAPLGRMALTNYLLQSLICASYFFSFGLGRWGMPRAQQLLFVAVVYAAQVAFSHWWLTRYRYGPMEWFWRGFTYGNTPAFRL